MDYLIALSPELDISVAGFTAAWNSDPNARTLAYAKVARAGAQTFDPTLAAAVMSVAGTITIGVLSNFLTDWIRDQWRARYPDDRERVRVTQIPQPNGPPILVVTVIRD